MGDKFNFKRTLTALTLALGLTASAPAYSFAASLAAPSIKSISSTESSITLSWNKISGASGYQVYRDGAELGKQTALSKTDSGLKASTSYSYKVRAYKKTTVKKKYYYNSKTKKWVTKKPAAKYWKGKRIKYVSSTKYSYGSFSSVKSCKTKDAPVPVTANIRSSAPMSSENVLAAFEKLGFQLKIDAGASSTGYFSARDACIILRRNDSNVYHELGHFVSFVAGNVDTSSKFTGIYNEEKSLYDGRNPGYVLGSSQEYFAESYRDYVLYKDSLKAKRPKTYAAIEDAVGRITDTQVNRILALYGDMWK